MSIKSPFLTTRETAEYLNAPLPRTSILVRMNYFPAFKVGGRWKVHKDKLDKWILDQIKNRS